MEISIFTNQVRNGWHPNQLETFLAGNEESIVHFSAALANAGHTVTVYSSIHEPHKTDQGVQYLPRDHFNINAYYQVLITVKDRLPWLRAVDAGIKIHWSNDVERRWTDGCFSAIDVMVTLSTYHRERMAWLPEDKSVIIPLGVDIELYKPGAKKELALYATSPDRGLDTLLADWSRIREKRPGLELFVTYDWKGIRGTQGEAQLMNMLQQPGVQYGLLTQAGMAEKFAEAKYYIHPLNRMDSDLFGFGPQKAQMSDCKLVLPSVKDNGFRDVVREFIPYREFLTGSDDAIVNHMGHVKPTSWNELVRKRWLPLIQSMVEVRDVG